MKTLEEIKADAARRALDAIPRLFQLTDPSHAGFNKSAWDAVSAWRPAAEKPWLGLIGPTGKSKSRIAYLYAAEELARITDVRSRYSIRFTTSYDIAETVMRLHSSCFEEKREARKALDRLRGADILLIDDLGKGRPTPAVAAELFALIDHRYSNVCRTIWTANGKPEELAAGMPDDMAGPFAGRLNECSKIFAFK